MAKNILSKVDIVTKPADIEAYTSSHRSPFMAIVESIQNLEQTKAVRLNVTGADKKRIQYIKQSIRKLYAKTKQPGEVRFAPKGAELFIWLNRV